jgi:hypothetical protein
MKHRKERNRHELKKEREFRKFVIISLVVILGIVAFGFYISRPPSPNISHAQVKDIESYIRAKVTQQTVMRGAYPALIYYKTVDTGIEGFLCSGTVFTDPARGLQIITAEHVFRKDMKANHTLEVKLLRGELNTAHCYINGIVRNSKDFNGYDMVVCDISDTPTVPNQFSDYTHEETGKSFYANVVILGKKLPTVRSIVSGETFPTIGYYRLGDESAGTNGAVFIIADCHMESGESGTGFVDPNGGLWILHGGPGDPDRERQILDEYQSITKKTASGIALLSGPYGGSYDDGK